MAEILTMGNEYWGRVAAGMLRCAGFDAAFWEARREDVPAVLRWWRPLRGMAYYLGRTFRAAQAVHVISPPSNLHMARAARLMGKRVILHWIGSDTLSVTEVAAAGAHLLRSCRRLAHAHFADSPEIAAELSRLGIVAEVFRLLPDTLIPAAEVPMPAAPAVLSYWATGRREFYHGEIVDALADEFPDVRFLVVGSTGDGEPQHRNMTYLGRLDGLEDVYRQVSVYVRLPEHDSMSAMVLESLARGRWVIYNKPVQGAELATTMDEVRDALRRCLARRGANVVGREHVRSNFSPGAESARISGAYRSALGRGDRGGRNA